MITRRRFTVCSGAAVRAIAGAAATVAACAAVAQARRPLIGVLTHGTEMLDGPRIAALRDALAELGYVDGRTCRLEVRWTDGRIERLPELARELMALRPDVVVAQPVVAARAFHDLSRTVPIVMATGAGAQRAGLIESLSRPGGNVTGLTNQGDELTTKLFELLHDVAPGARRVLALSSGLGAAEQEGREGARLAAQRYGLTLINALAATPREIGAVAERCERERCQAMVALLDPNLSAYRKEVVAMAARLRIPAAYPNTEYPAIGGLLGYSTDPLQLNRRAAGYVDRILKGAKPSELPVERPTKFELVVNRRTARDIGLTLPQSLLLRADRVID